MSDKMSEVMRRLRRFGDFHPSRLALGPDRVKRLCLLVSVILFLLWIFIWILVPSRRRLPSSPVEECLANRLEYFGEKLRNMDAGVMHYPKPWEGENSFMPYVGNGYIGVGLAHESVIRMKPIDGRTINFPSPFRPVVQFAIADEKDRDDVFVTEFDSGLTHRIACMERQDGAMIEVKVTYFASRIHPSVFEQNVTIMNPSSKTALIQLEQLGFTGDPPFTTEEKKLNIPGEDNESSYVAANGVVERDGYFAGVGIAYKKVPNAVQIAPNNMIHLRMVTVFNYGHAKAKRDAQRVQKVVGTKSEKDLKVILERNKESNHDYYLSHVNAWKKVWTSGFTISYSHAYGAINGDRINATLYYTLSQVRSPLYEVGVQAREVQEANDVLSYAEGCYGGHQTLQAPTLWASLATESDVLRITNLWLLTLEKLGCHRLLKAGDAGVMQGMLLSFGALKFRNSHLEFNTNPKDLHRDYHFRRIMYGNATHVNVSVVVGEDNKAVMYVALDRKDKDYFACDAGCLDQPIELGTQKIMFPVKVTDPLTSILYITADRKHAEELHLSIHVQEILEAPAHEHHLISMHKHGSGHSAMSTTFWVFLSLIIISFHLFLFHLVYTEYFGSSQQDRAYRSRKVSDF